MAGEYAVPLLLVALIVLAIASWRVVHPPLALGLTLIIGASTAAYLSLRVIPRLVEAVEAPDVAAPFEATNRDARPSEMAIQLYRGAQLVGHCALAGPEAPPPPRGPLRVERAGAGKGYQVWSGATLIGDLPESALPEVQPAAEPRPSFGGAAAARPQLYLTDKVVLGGSASLGQMAPAGLVSVQFVRLDERGNAIVKVNAPALGPATPTALELGNKTVGTQSFERMDFDVAIREASFVADPPWAAFAVIAHR